MLENDSEIFPSELLAKVRRDQVPTEENPSQVKDDESIQSVVGSIQSRNEDEEPSHEELQNEVIKRLSEAIQILNASNQSLIKTNKKQISLIKSLRRDIRTQILMIQSQNKMIQSLNGSMFTFVFRLLNCAWSGLKWVFGWCKFTRERRRPLDFISSLDFESSSGSASSSGFAI